MRPRSAIASLGVIAALVVPAWCSAQLPYFESFDGPDGAAWPAPWTTMSAHLPGSDLHGNRGRMTGESANGGGSAVGRMLLVGFAETNIEATMTLEFEDVANQGIGFYARQNGGTLREYVPHGQGYAMFLKGAWGWPQDLGVWREIDGVETQFANGYDPVAGGLQNGVRYRVRYRVTQTAPDSTLIQARVWPETLPEPDAWTVETFDSRPELQSTPGGFALDIYNFQGTASTFIDDLWITTYPGPLAVDARTTAPRVALSAPRPHPVAGRARITCSLATAGRARLSVFDLAGRRVAEVHEGWLAAGASSIEWNAVAANGRAIPAGVYLLRLDAGGASAMTRVVVTR